MAVVSPSHRQSKTVIRKIAFFAEMLPKAWVSEVQRTKIDFSNGSVVESLSQ